MPLQFFTKGYDGFISRQELKIDLFEEEAQSTMEQDKVPTGIPIRSIPLPLIRNSKFQYFTFDDVFVS